MLPRMSSKMVVSKTRNGVTRNRVTGFFFFFVSSSNLLLLTSFVCSLFYCLFFFQGKRKSLKLFVFGGVFTPFNQIYRTPKEIFRGRTFSRFREVGRRSLWFSFNVYKVLLQVRVTNLIQSKTIENST